MGFRKPHKLLTEAPGSHIDGVWQPGVRSVTQCVASVQPDDEVQDLQPLGEGRHESDRVKVYTSSSLLVSADGENIQPDIVVQDGVGYELVSRAAYRAGVISHYRYKATRIFKFTNDADWTSGALVRP